MAEFALNNAVHASTGLTPFFVNNAHHPRVSALLAVERPSGVDGAFSLGVGEIPDVSESSRERRAAAISKRDAGVESAFTTPPNVIATRVMVWLSRRQLRMAFKRALLREQRRQRRSTMKRSHQQLFDGLQGR